MVFVYGLYKYPNFYDTNKKIPGKKNKAMNEMEETDDIKMLQKKIELTEDISIITERNTANEIQAVCSNCNKRFKSMRSVIMHSKYTTPRHVVIFIDRGNYDKDTGFRTKTNRIMK